MICRVGLLGAGVISEQYLTNLTRFPDVEVGFIADLDTARASARAEQFGVPASGTPEEVLASDMDLVVNLTVPAAHHDTTIAALEAGKHVWLEKPLATSVADARRIVEVAKQRGLQVGCAPDAVLGRSTQTALRALAKGAAGAPSWALATFATAGPQGWHPAPQFLFSDGGGPLLDIGPYYLTVLAHAFGPVVKVHATSTAAQPTRTVGSGPDAGSVFDVTVDTTIFATLSYGSGHRASAVFTFDSGVRHARLEITGSLGTVAFADPNRFDGEVRIHSAHGKETEVIASPAAAATRGIGIVEMIRAMAAGAGPRASAEMAAHVVEVMAAILASAAVEGEGVGVASTFPPVEPLPEDWDPFMAFVPGSN